MKKFVILFFFFASTRMGWGQASVGPVLDLNFSNAVGGKGGNKFKMGFDVGLYLRLHFTEMIAVQSEILYSRKGYKRHTFYTVSGVAIDTNVVHKLSYINFPLLLHYAITENLFVQVGPQIGFIINDRQQGSISATANGGTASVQAVDTNSVYGFSTTEYSFALRGGFTFPFGLSTSLGLTYGITKLYNTSFVAHNFSIAISAAAPFSIFRGGGAKGGVIRRKI